MAKTATTTKTSAPAGAGPVDEQRLARVTAVQESLAVAGGFEDTDSRGKEQITQDDVVLPFIAIAQKTSPQIETGHDKYIDGLKFTDMFNSLTGEVYGTGPVAFIPIMLRKHAIEFKPFEEGGGIVDRNVPWDDPRCQFNGDEKPTATRFYDWVVLLVPTLEMVVLSFKSTNISVAKQFQQFLNVRKGPAFAGRYTVGVVSTKNASGTFGKFVIKPNGKPEDAEAAFAAEVYDTIKGKTVIVDHEPEAPEGGAAEGGGAPASDM